MTSTYRRAMPALAASALIALASGASASPYSVINHAAATSKIKVHALRGGVSMLEGSGGNIGVLVGPEGLFLVDTGIAVSEAKLKTALRGLSRKPLRYAVNTHWHWDHTDGNGWVRRAGAQIIAERHTLDHLKHTIRVEEWEHTFTPVPAKDLPTQAVQAEKLVAFGSDRVRIRPYMPSHTDGDLSVYFEKADVLATGDTFWNGVYPFIDYVGGGGIDGAIKAADANLAMAGPRTIIIPGHGPVANRADAQAFRDMLVTIRGRVAKLKAEGKTLAQAQAARPTADFDAKWGQSIINGQLFTALVYRGV
ncbi:MBL fold metallo-hydrolase [Caulobacter sp. 602-1]|uniref:MBL fold metallo-hydrolase n=1 Tax=Caulobacter sp. 602-1 TaxID=2492472 RepID=UPI0018F443BF|nr:MBL fold metallo-hydrolase [Caulobacter sp. 602-1]